jgi:hypothetical protein
MSPDRPALEPEIEVTPEMIDAGVSAWALFEAGDRSDWLVSEIYRAMEVAKLHPRNGDASPRDERMVSR